ncbi:MAG: hypothetical protein DMG07_18690, partial [Acidobacteria bacterium]
MVFLLSIALAFLGQDESAPGLVASYRDANSSVRAVVPTPNFTLRADESVHPAISAQFEAEWSGTLSVLETGDYAFECSCEVELAGRSARGASVRLVPGKHPVRIVFRRAPGPARVELSWRSDKFPLEPVPAVRFEHRKADGPGPQELRVERGRGLVEQLGCANCHASAAPALARPRAPHLTGIGSRARESWLL